MPRGRDTWQRAAPQGSGASVAGADRGGDGGDSSDGDDDGESLTDEDTVRWVVLGIVAVVALIVIGAVASSMGRRRQQEQSRHAGERRVAQERIGRVVGGADWVHDQVALEVLGTTADPQRLRMNWDDARRRIHDLSSEATTLAVNSDPDTELALRNLSRTLGALAGAIDTNVQLRVSAAPDDAAAQEALRASNLAVESRRTDLQAAIAPLRQRR